MNTNWIVKFIDWGVKIASLCITAPATWAVAYVLFDHMPQPWLTIICIGSVFVIEGVMIGNWLMLEYKKDALPEQKARYALTALVMFLVMCIVAWADEGLLGLVFRVALLAALVGSGWDTYVETWHTVTKTLQKDVDNNPGYVRLVDKLTVEYKKAEVLADSATRHLALQLSQEAQEYGLRLAAERKKFIDDQMHERSLQEIPAHVDSVNAVNPVNFTPPLQLDPVQKVLVLKKSEPDTIDLRIVQFYKANPGAGLRKAAEYIGKSHTDISKRIKELENFGLVKKIDGKVYVVEQGEIIKEETAQEVLPSGEDSKSN